MLDVTIESLFQRKQFRTTLVNGEHVHAERCLHCGELIDLVDQNLGPCVSLQGDLNTRIFVGEIPHPRDPGKDLLVHQLRDPLLEGGAVHAIGHFRDGDNGGAVLLFVHLHLASHLDRPATGREVALNSLHSANLASHRKVGPLHMLHQFGQRDLGIVDLGTEGIHDLTQVVGRQVRGHPHRDSGPPVNQEIGKGRRKNRRFRACFVVIGNEVDRPFIEVGHHGHPKMRQARLGIPHGGWRISFGRSEISLPIHQDLPHGPVLGHVDKSGIDHRFPVGVVVTRSVATDLGTFPVGLVGRQGQVVHRIKDATLGRLQTVPDIGQSTRNDHRHRVVQEGLGELVGDVDRLDIVF